MSIPTIQGLAGITAEPEMKYTPGGKAVLSVRLAFSDRKYNEQTRQWDTSKSFYVDGTAWEETAERLSAQLAKGDQVYVEGRIETQQWEKDGEKKSKPVLQLRTVRKLEKGTAQPQQNGGGFNSGGNPAHGGQPAPTGNWGNQPANAGGWGNGPTGADQSPPF
jgi:single-strand DNA-binding protein